MAFWGLKGASKLCILRVIVMKSDVALYTYRRLEDVRDIHLLRIDAVRARSSAPGARDFM
jgi:hypothetical protein